MKISKLSLKSPLRNLFKVYGNLKNSKIKKNILEIKWLVLFLIYLWFMMDEDKGKDENVNWYKIHIARIKLILKCSTWTM